MTTERFPAETTKVRRRGSSSRRGGWLALAGAAAVTALVAGCSAGSTPTLPTVAPPSTSNAPPASTPPVRPGCDDKDVKGSRVQSYAPDSALPPGDSAAKTLNTIKSHNKIKVGVSADNLLFGYRNPITGALEGFDIDIVSQIAKEIFGTTKGHIEYVVENFAQRIPDLQSGRVDLVADIMTINCTRWNQIAFSTEYFHAGQQVLVRNNARYNDINDLNKAKAKVCTADGSTGSENLKIYKQVKPVLVNDISDCMVLFQQGTVDGIISDNTVVAGFHAQDPYARIAGDEITDEPYGLGIPPKNVDFVQYINSLLDKWRTNGFLKDTYAKWLPAPAKNAPPPVYGRALP
ncbi:MAG TPA: transporter substrate-binding domain-containing protein [Jatrophihabitantaceae bacterium]|jgi:polar amino acid transport system substrate-binding protein